MATETKREFRESIDTTLLILAFILGVGLAVVLKAMGLPPWVPALAAGSVIIIYAVGTYFSKTARLEPEQIGDNCYYLGFCITLASLAYTLYGLGAAGDDAAMLSDVISGFGVALSSTVVGVMARVVLLQFRVDLAARDKEARSQLNQVMRSFHGEMLSSVTSTREAITQIRQTLDEHTAATIDQNKRMQESFEERLAALVEEAVTGVKAAMDEVVESGKDMNRRLSASSRANMTSAETAMQASMVAVTEDLKRATATLEEQMQHANDSSIATLERVVAEVSAAMSLLSEEAAKTINASQEAQTGEMSRAVEAVAGNVFELAHQIGAQKDKLRDALDGYAQQTETARREVGALVKESSAAREEARKAAQAVETAAAKVAGSAAQMEKAVGVIASRIAPAAGPAAPPPSVSRTAPIAETTSAAGALATSPAAPSPAQPVQAARSAPLNLQGTIATPSVAQSAASGGALKSTTAVPSDVRDAKEPKPTRSWLGLRK